MGITDELRTGGIYRFPSNRRVFTEEELTAIADRIDAEVKDKLTSSEYNMRREHDEWVHDRDNGWVRLPLDADGEPIHVGDVMEWVDEPGITRTVTSIQLAEDGWWVYINGTGRRPDKYCHHHAPTVEDVLREFADAIDIDKCYDFDATIAEYAAKLRVAEGVEP